MKKQVVILISGTGTNMLRIIEEAQTGILRELCKVCLVVSNKPDAKGLKSASEKNVPIHCIPSQGKSRPEFEEQLLQKLSEWNPDLIVLAGFMRILSSHFVSQYPRRIVNIHPADTNSHKGLDGYKWAYDSRLSETKITVHFVDEHLDSGEIIAQKRVDLKGVQSEDELRKRGLAVEHEFYSQVLKSVLESL